MIIAMIRTCFDIRRATNADYLLTYLLKEFRNNAHILNTSYEKMLTYLTHRLTLLLSNEIL